jgi:hypothetical protein
MERQRALCWCRVSNESNHEGSQHHILEANDWQLYATYYIRSRADHNTFSLRNESLPHPVLGYCVCALRGLR